MAQYARILCASLASLGLCAAAAPAPAGTTLGATVEGDSVAIAMAESGIVGSAVPFKDATGTDFTDLWWSGPGESGWGLSIVQHRDTLFSVIYAYGSSGLPAWYVISGGTWNAERTAYTGAVYAPQGSPFHAYDTSRLNVGAPVGSLTITFTDASHATLDYTINGVTDRKEISRQRFGSGSGFNIPIHADMWWGGTAQSGWGVAVLEQFNALFAIWFTYDDDGQATWLVMPSGSWSATDVYEGRIYRTRSSPWLGRRYNLFAFRISDVGSFRLRFTGDTATLEYVIDGRSGTLPLSRQPF